jgi:uncharacterized protein YcbX
MERLLSEIWIYPVKSLAGIRVQEAVVMEKGLEHDRRFMLIDARSRFITQREHPELVFFEPQMMNGKLQITHRLNREVIHLDLMPDHSETFTATIWNDVVSVSEVDVRVSEWFSDQLKMFCRLVFFPEENLRPIKHPVQNNQQVSLADAYPFLIIGQASLDELNSRLKEPVGMNRFRPNFVFTGGLPHAEDQWNALMIGCVRFERAKPCARCVLTTVNPSTGRRGKEPLQTLSSYRKSGNKIYFGLHLFSSLTGRVFQGDVINPLP